MDCYFTVDEAKTFLKFAEVYKVSFGGMANACREIIRLNEEQSCKDADYNSKVDSLHEVIEALKAELDKYRWIPVSERLPKDGEPILFKSQGLKYSGFRNKKGQWTACLECVGYDNEIDGWMPIPIPPEVE